MSSPQDALGAAVASVRIGRAEGCRVSATGRWGMRYADLEVCGFHVLVRGTAWLVTDDAPPRRLDPGDVVLAQPRVEHGFASAPAPLATLAPAVLGTDEIPDADVEFLCGAYWMDQGRFAAHLVPVPDVVVVSVDDPDGRRILDLLASELDTVRPGTAVATPALLDLLLTHLLRRWFDDHGEVTLPAQGDPEIAAALRALHADPLRAWTVRELGERVRMPARQFSRRFTAVMGAAPMSYLTSWRLARAAQLLRDGTRPLAAIARAAGYANEFAFSAAFRREFGVAPGRYRIHARLGSGGADTGDGLRSGSHP